MILTTKARYAVMAMVDIALNGKDKPVQLAIIAERQGIDLGYLEQIFIKLKKSELVVSTRGPGGGYQLAKDRSELFVIDIMNSVEESFKVTRCGAGSICMDNKTQCVTHHLWDDLTKHIHSFLKDVSLLDVCNKKTLKSRGIAI